MILTVQFVNECAGSEGIMFCPAAASCSTRRVEGAGDGGGAEEAVEEAEAR
jgi:hypothetical protein